MISTILSVPTMLFAQWAAARRENERIRWERRRETALAVASSLDALRSELRSVSSSTSPAELGSPVLSFFHVFDEHHGRIPTQWYRLKQCVREAIAQGVGGYVALAESVPSYVDQPLEIDDQWVEFAIEWLEINARRVRLWAEISSSKDARHRNLLRYNAFLSLRGIDERPLLLGEKIKF